MVGGPLWSGLISFLSYPLWSDAIRSDSVRPLEGESGRGRPPRHWLIPFLSAPEVRTSSLHERRAFQDIDYGI